MNNNFYCPIFIMKNFKNPRKKLRLALKKLSRFLFRPKIKIKDFQEKNEESKIGNYSGEKPSTFFLPRNEIKN